jgi:hypothetical protein
VLAATSFVSPDRGLEDPQFSAYQAIDWVPMFSAAFALISLEGFDRLA